MAIVELTDLFTTQEKQGAVHLRTIGQLTVWQADENDIVEGTAGVSLISREADLASAFPEPVTDAGVPWMWWHPLTFGGIIGTAVGQFPSFRIDIDIKVKRRFPRGEDGIHLMVENGDGTFTFQFAVQTRTLLQLA